MRHNLAKRQHPIMKDILILFLIPMIAGLDFYVGESYSLFLLYLFPIYLSSLLRGRLYGLFYATLCSLSWVYVDLLFQNTAAHLYQVIFMILSRTSLFAILSWLFSSNQKLLYDLKAQAFRDSKTGAYNYRAFMEFAEIELLKAARNASPLILAYFDMDNFKLTNDKFGHAIGDQVLIDFTTIAQKHMRSSDIFARLGGDEFIALIVEVDLDQAIQILERIRNSFNDMMTSKQLPVTVSIGVSSLPSTTTTLNDAIQDADRLMYQAKSKGRNQIFSTHTNTSSISQTLD